MKRYAPQFWYSGAARSYLRCVDSLR
jgi:hypothetical protein